MGAHIGACLNALISKFGGAFAFSFRSSFEVGAVVRRWKRAIRFSPGFMKTMKSHHASDWRRFGLTGLNYAARNLFLQCHFCIWFHPLLTISVGRRVLGMAHLCSSFLLWCWSLTNLLLICAVIALRILIVLNYWVAVVPCYGMENFYTKRNYVVCIAVLKLSRDKCIL